MSLWELNYLWEGENLKINKIILVIFCAAVAVATSAAVWALIKSVEAIIEFVVFLICILLLGG